jgi:hypothetical protein
MGHPAKVKKPSLLLVQVKIDLIYQIFFVRNNSSDLFLGSI